MPSAIADQKYKIEPLRPQKGLRPRFTEAPERHSLALDDSVRKHASRKSDHRVERNGHVRKQSELDSLQEKPLMIGQVPLAISKWPKFLITLSHKEKEDDFMIMKGSRLPQRPKKRAKHVEKFVSSVTPGSWLCELKVERYLVKNDRKRSKKKCSGLRAMEDMDSDSE